MRTSDFDYQLPQELIAQTPIEPRDCSRLMVVSRADGSIQHRRFYDLPEYLRRGDVLAFNDSRVIPARLYGRKVGSGGHVELLLLHRLSPGVWRALVRPGRRMRPGAAFEIPADGERMLGEVLEVEEDGARVVKLSSEEMLRRVGTVPLPPYIREPLKDAERYQTVYSRIEGSVAAPTAGLHFTPALLERVRALGVETVFTTLHVGWDTFRPVKEEDASAHKMHTEYWELGREAAAAINRAKREGRRVISVGTTTVRLLEQAALRSPEGSELAAGACPVGACRGVGPYAPTPLHAPTPLLAEGSGWADLFIFPGFKFRIIDALVTNFHLPRSTLLMLVSAFAGRELILKAYHEAIEQRYRFYSFGDAMLVL